RRLEGASYRSIATAMGVSPSLVHEYVCRALKEFVPPEDARQVLQQELQRFDALLEKYMPPALAGDEQAAELCLKISHQRSRLCGLYPDGKGGGVHVNVATRPREPMQIVFVKGLQNEPLPGPYDLAGDEYKQLLPPAPIPIAPPSPEPPIEPEPIEAPP